MSKKELPKGFTEIDNFKGGFKMNGSAFEFSDVLKFNSATKGIVEGQVYRYPVAPKKLYFTTMDGQFLDDVDSFAAIEKLKMKKINKLKL